MQIPGHIPWAVHRVAVSGYYHVSPVEILEHWPLALLCDANDVCAALDAARSVKS